MKKTGYKQRVLKYLVDFGSITTWEAITNFGATRLSAIIFSLKEDGYCFGEEWIEKTNRYGEDVKFKKYILLKDNGGINNEL